MNRLFLFATYWNEIEWIDTSLEQIKKLNPYKVYICDGCYDEERELHSTDGTYEKILDFSKANSNVVVINPIRLGRIGHLRQYVLSKHSYKSAFIGEMKRVYAILRCNKYRLNQAATFNYMLECSEIEENDWFMTYDCDQFYSDLTIEKVHMLNTMNDYDLIVGKELTFFDGFQSCSRNYEKRDYNNMPHRYHDGIFFMPTRLPVQLYKGRYEVISKVNNRKFDSGYIYHYKFKSSERIKEGYSLGDRKEPEKERMLSEPFYEAHPQVMKKRLNKEND